MLLWYFQVKEVVCNLGLKSHGSRKALESRYRSFRQYVETAIDNGSHISLEALVREFNSNLCREAFARVAAPSTDAVLAECPASFADLIKSTKARDKKTRDSCGSSCKNQESDQQATLFSKSSQIETRSDQSAEDPRVFDVLENVSESKYLERVIASENTITAGHGEQLSKSGCTENLEENLEVEIAPDSDGCEQSS